MRMYRIVYTKKVTKHADIVPNGIDLLGFFKSPACKDKKVQLAITVVNNTRNAKLVSISRQLEST